MATQKKLIDYVRSLKGMSEEPAGSNHVTWIDGTNLWIWIGYPDLDGKPGGKWCGAAGYKIDMACGNQPPYGAGTAISCPALRDWAMKNGYWTQSPSVGDKVIYDDASHMGTVIDISAWKGGKGHITAGEGNFSDSFVIEDRKLKGAPAIDGFVKRGYLGMPPHEELPPVTAPEQRWSEFVKLPDGRTIPTHVDYWVGVGLNQKYAVATMAIQFWLTEKKIPTEIDGHFGKDTQKCVKAFQKASGIQVTGVVDAATAVSLDITTP
jgi:peptidoglycan hydrolase-like protein with peptidoglycan-binding domain